MDYLATRRWPIAPQRRGQERMRSIVFVASSQAMPPTLKQAVEDAFPWTVVEQVGHIDEATRIFPNTVSVMLVHQTFVAEAERRAADLFRYHPMALTAVLDDGTKLEGEGAVRLFDSPLVRSVLPINVRQNVSLSILGLLLQGIEYFPRGLLSMALQRPQAPPPQADGGPLIPAHLRVLTKREMEVLDLVQRGLQNKSIANDLHLSGHTVKIHLHNIITKLGAHNRTEAAAIYRDAARGILH